MKTLFQTHLSETTAFPLMEIYKQKSKNPVERIRTKQTNLVFFSTQSSQFSPHWIISAHSHARRPLITFYSCPHPCPATDTPCSCSTDCSPRMRTATSFYNRTTRCTQLKVVEKLTIPHKYSKITRQSEITNVDGI